MTSGSSACFHRQNEAAAIDAAEDQGSEGDGREGDDTGQ